MKIVIDAEGSAMGRIASLAAKEALSGNEVNILNSEKAIVTGNWQTIVEEFKKLRALNTNKPEKGPFFSKSTEKIMKRAIRGMLPDYRLGRGRVAWKKIKCYNGIPAEFHKDKIIKLKRDKSRKSMSLEELKMKA